MPRLRVMAFGALSLAYPFLVYSALGHFEPRWMAVLLFLLAFLRALGSGQKVWWFATVGTGVLAAIATVLNQAMPLKLYPALVNLVMLLVFAASLRFPPTVVERLARLQEPDLPATAVRYTRKVTQVWCVFFVVNGTLATLTAVWASDRIWAFYNGFLAYVMMAMLFAAEWLVRQRVKAGHTGG